MTKKVLKRKRKEEAEKENEPEPKTLPAKRMSDEPAPKKVKWINKQRVLVFSTRGINHRHRHLMDDLKTLMPHHRSECKMERSKNLQVVNEMCEIKNCNKTIMFEGRKKKDLYVWFSNVPAGPSGKFLVENIYTMGELKMTGNCLKGSRPLLSFDDNFSTKPHYTLVKELFIQIFGVPNHHPKSQPFFDHVFTFTVLDNRIWFRNFQILTEDGGLAEIGPRFVLNPVKIFSGSFGGETLWENPSYVSPAKYRQSIMKKAAGKYINRVEQKMVQEANKPKESYASNPLDEIFKDDALEKALKVDKKEVATQETKKGKMFGTQQAKKGKMFGTQQAKKGKIFGTQQAKKGKMFGTHKAKKGKMVAKKVAKKGAEKHLKKKVKKESGPVKKGKN